MSLPITKRTADHSGNESFSFSFFCDKCGKEWTSPVVRFEAGGFTKIDLPEIQQRIWADEHRLAFEQANLEAHLNFNHCEACGSWLCDSCFDLERLDDSRVCKDCSGK